jgi:hypothetical protein
MRVHLHQLRTSRVWLWVQQHSEKTNMNYFGCLMKTTRYQSTQAMRQQLQGARKRQLPGAGPEVFFCPPQLHPTSTSSARVGSGFSLQQPQWAKKTLWYFSFVSELIIKHLGPAMSRQGQ